MGCRGDCLGVSRLKLRLQSSFALLRYKLRGGRWGDGAQWMDGGNLGAHPLDEKGVRIIQECELLAINDQPTF